ncbi:MAG: hypothetical protein IKU25_01840 [Clostridia bacterium]|nr:hypothetical protein [Clostridia bacterium]
MKIVTVIVLIVAILTAGVALNFAIGSSQSPLYSDNSTGSNVTGITDEKELLESIATDSLKTGEKPLFATLEDEIYSTQDFAEFYLVTGDGIDRIDGMKTLRISALVSGEVCELVINYVEYDGKVVGGGVYSKTIEEAGVYEVEINLRCALTEMPTALDGREGEKLLLVGFEADDYYSEAFAIDLNGGYSRNLFSQDERDRKNSEGYVMLTDELIKNSGEYLYFFSSREYERPQDSGLFNKEANIDLFRTKGGVDELVAKEVHHHYLFFVGDGQLSFIRSKFATLTYMLGSVPVMSYKELGFEVVQLNLDTMTESMIRQFNVSFSAEYKRFGDYLVRLSTDTYDAVQVYNMINNTEKTFNNVGVRMLLVFDVSDDGRYLAIGGSTTTVSELNQCIRFIDTVSGETLIVKGKGLFLAVDEQFGFIDSDNFINTSFVGSGEDFTFHVTDIKEIFKKFKESVEN